MGEHRCEPVQRTAPPAPVFGLHLQHGEAQQERGPDRRQPVRLPLAIANIASGLGADAPAPAGPFGDRFGASPAPSRSLTPREALLGSSFTLIGAQDASGGSLAFWGRASQGRFDGAERGDGTDITLDGEVTTGMLGADYARGDWLLGLALTQSSSDGGDAETGFGVELGGGLKWVAPALGLSLDVSGRTLLTHENDDLEDRGFSAQLGFDPAPATQRGPSLSLRQDFGGQASGGLDGLFAPDSLEDRTGSEAASCWTMEAAYGFPAFGGRFTGSPHVGLGLATGTRYYSLGWRLTPEGASAPDLSLGVKATLRESDTQAPEHRVGVELRARW